MASVVVRADASGVTVSLRKFALSLGAKDQLLRNIGLGQLESVRQTFAEQGSPSGSWAPLSLVSLQWRKYKNGGEGHRLLIDKGLLLNSITLAAEGNSVVIGTALKYAGVHQCGFDGAQNVRPYSYTRRQKSRDASGKFEIVNKLGRKQTVTRKTVSGIATVNVRGFSRHIHIPARPFLVFRPEDPARIHEETELFVKQAAAASGLEMV
jgi:phage virion morphogenesis protein